jgi:hypothetical protein
MNSPMITGYAVDEIMWNKFKAVLDACNDAGLEPPVEVVVYFDGYTVPTSPTIFGQTVDAITKNKFGGFDIDLMSIPGCVTSIIGLK